jgi:hypothetical protein
LDLIKNRIKFKLSREENSMKKYLFAALAIVFSIYMFGCQKKQPLEESQVPLSMETMSAINATTPPPPPAQPPEAKLEATQAAPTTAAKLEPLPPGGPYKPTAIEIQTALKNAGYYTGNVDGKIGPKSKKAIAEFQKANGLKTDGKVGSMTWEALSKYLNAAPAETKRGKKR